MSLGEKIKCARQAANITQEELGRICGTTKQTIYKYEMGIVTNIPFDRLEKIANAIGIPAEQLLGWGDDSSKNKALTFTEEDERMREFASLFSKLSPDERKLVIAQMKGILSEK